jgi:hypothetical protein
MARTVRLYIAVIVAAGAMATGAALVASAMLNRAPADPLRFGSFLALAAVLHYGLNTVLVAIVLWLVEDRPVSSIRRNCHFWSFPFYLVGAVAAGLMVATSRNAGWAPSLLVLPLFALVYVSYGLHLRKREDALSSS